jgi:peptidoglycan/xylan/chitin deacetylase (PgdA/CDA1 family)
MTDVRHKGFVATKKAMQGVLSSRYLTPMWLSLSRQRVSIFALHRFAMPPLDVAGHEPAPLRRLFERLRRERYKVFSLEEACRRLGDGSGFPPASLVFTVDDGYRDFAEVAAPVFAAFDIPVTVFATTGFLDGTSWLWWDRIEHAIRTTSARSLSIRTPDVTVNLELGDGVNRSHGAMTLAEDLTRLSEVSRALFIEALATAADIEIPASAPARYAAMTWDDARRLERQGVTFAPHTVTHPILPRTTDADAAWQIAESWRIIQKRLARPLPMFAYPNGDYTARDVDTVARTGLTCAVTSRPGYVHVAQFDQPTGRFAMPRFPYPDHHPDAVCLTATGLTRVTAAARRAFAFLR